MCHMESLDFTYERRGSVGVFSGFTICCQPRTEIGETFQGVLDFKAQEALDRILALRGGQVPQRAKELIKRLGGDTDVPGGT